MRACRPRLARARQPGGPQGQCQQWGTGETPARMPREGPGRGPSCGQGLRSRTNPFSPTPGVGGGEGARARPVDTGRCPQPVISCPGTNKAARAIRAHPARAAAQQAKPPLGGVLVGVSPTTSCSASNPDPSSCSRAEQQEMAPCCWAFLTAGLGQPFEK